MNLVTPSFILNLLLFSIGVWVLIKGSDGVIENASIIARCFGISDLIIGITLVSIGTSMPELATNVYAAIINESTLAIGNVVGSNITNVLLVAGIAVTGLGLISIDQRMFFRDAMIMIGVYLIFSFFSYFTDGSVYRISRREGLILFLGSVTYIIFLLKYEGRQIAKSPINSPISDDHKNVTVALWKAFLSCFWVIFGAKLIVDNVVWTAIKLDVPQELVSATVIALGTSLPEVAVTVSGIVKKKRDIALGNIIGSNTFNLLLVMGVTAAIRPVPVSADLRCYLIPYMLMTGFGFLLFMRTSWALVRWEGIAFLIGYGLFIGWNVVNMTS